MNAMIEVDLQRLRDERQTYLITLYIKPCHGWAGGGVDCAVYPQAHAVVDDFGTLVIVRGWQ